jgi:2-keto-3-deoxy-L-rhamnonate aldolase RhmA
VYLKQRLAGGEHLLGAGIYSGSPDMIEYAAPGMDWLWWESQHTHASWETLLHGVRTAQLIGVPVLVRTWTHDGGTIERLLDTGAEGIIVPMVNTADQARAIVSHCYYPPAGNRSFGSLRTERIEENLGEWNRRIVVVAQIETPQAVANAEAIAQVPGVDALFVGIRDLALRKGRHSDHGGAHAVVAEDLAHIVQVCRQAGKAAAATALTPDTLRRCLANGCRLICAGMDVDHVQADYGRMREAFAQLRRATQPDQSVPGDGDHRKTGR